MSTKPHGSSLLRTVEAALTQLDLDAEAVERRPHDTIRPRSRDSAAQGPSEAIQSALVLGDTLGEGGMGVVFAAEEEALGRTVAVKSLRPERREPRSVRKLLQEAWVTGRLEHPNVVPVYRIEIDDDGAPMVVLKRVEGDDWATLMHEPSAIRERYGATDALDWNLRVLLAVCNAVRFAHDRGVLHRDIKPDNVMVGPYGEVYLVDWGLAVALDETAGTRLPLASDTQHLAGTPSYMAPEQLGAGSGLSERTDVYLLGATLYEILTGAPPHVGETLMQLVSSISISEPDTPRGAPEALATLARRALQRDATLRPPDVESFARALGDFLEHREALQLVSQASGLLNELRATLAERTGTSGDEGTQPIYRLFGECRFGFRQALALWADCIPAREGLAEATMLMVQVELDRGQPGAASALLADLDSAPTELTERVEAAAAEARRKEEELNRLADFMDDKQGGRVRRWVLLAIAGVWVLMPLLLQYLLSTGQMQLDHGASLASAVVVLIVVVAIIVPARRVLTRTSVNRLLTTGAVVAVLSELLMHLGPVLSGEPMRFLQRAQFLPWFAISAIGVVLVDRWLAVPAFAYASAFVLSAVWPEYPYLITAVCNLLTAVVLGIRWVPRIDAPETAP